MSDTPGPTDEAEPVDLSAAPGPLGSFEALIATPARDSMPVLAAGQELGERYVIERLIGAGGMGTVYLASDRSLERQVAIKLHQTGAGTDRLQREAVAMARLAHPNVVAVFEVGALGDQPFVAMEYVAGTTLRGWMAQAHTRREQLAMLIGAGTGLSAAHDAGLVHRDFKPENVLIGADQRARVGDFGLARGSQSESEPAATSSKLAGLTQAGAVIGTPAYMAPEQMTGGQVDARADQFAFCVVAWEVLVGERPFAGADLDALATAVQAGPRRPRGLRASIRQVLERGLSSDPTRRYPDMHGLLAALRRASRPRWPWIGVPVVALIAGGLAVAWPRAAVIPSCAGVGAELASLPRDLSTRMAALATPYARATAPVVARLIDGYADHYRDDARAACKAGLVDRAWSPELYDKSQTCLSIGLREASLMLAPAEVTAANAVDLAQLVASLPSTTNCTDPATLAAQPAMPVEHRDELIAARATLDAAEVEAQLGEMQRARQAVVQITGELALQPSIAARLALMRGLLLRADDKLVPAEKQVADAYFASRGIDDADTLLYALGVLIDLSGHVREDATAADGWIKNALADVARLGSRNRGAAAGIYSTAANVRYLQDDLPAALALARQALALRPDTRDRQTASIYAVDGAILCAMARYAECFAEEDQALGILREVLGPAHPQVALLLANFALDRDDAKRSVDALAFAKQAREILAGVADMAGLDVAEAENAVAAMLTNTNTERPEAQRLFTHARAIFVASLGPDHPDVALVDTNLALLDLDDHHVDLAIAKLERASAIFEHSVGPDSTRVAGVQYNLAAALRDAKRYDAALVAANRVVAIREKLAPATLPLATALVMAANIANLRSGFAEALALAQRALAIPGMAGPIEIRGWAELEEARARIGLHRDLPAARSELAEARALYEKIEMPARVTEADELLARLGHGG